MSRYQHKDISFDPPNGWLDSTVAKFHPKPSPVGSPPVPSITMSIEPLPHGVTARIHADHLLVKMARSVQGFEFLNREETLIGDKPAIVLRFQFKADEDAPDAMEQTMALIAAGTEKEPHIAILSIACPAQLAEGSMSTFANVLRSVRVEDVPPAQGSSPSIPPARPSSPALAEGDFRLGPMPGIRGRS